MGELNHRNAVSEIGRVLETAGYDCELEEGPFNLSAVKDNKCIIVLCSDDRELLQRFDQTPYTIVLGGAKTRCDKIIFTGNGYFQPKESELWTKDKLAGYIVDAAFARIWGEPFDIAAPSFAYVGPSAPPTLPPVGADMVIPMRISAKDAVRVARQDGLTILRMIPYWYYTYTSMGQATYKGKTVSFDEQGAGWINAINATETEFEGVTPEPGEIPQDATVVPPTSSKDEIKAQVMAKLVKKLTRHVRIKTTAGDAIFAEERDFKPAEEDIDLKIQKVYVPVWQVRGKKDIVEVNAFTGEELTVPSDEGCEVF
ncbi:MAG TPA: hypothetical protein O0X39_02465 [Methanocorpusculum sp.]|nr:hypothetical protein [Methanocorpusculum sp.]